MNTETTLSGRPIVDVHTQTRNLSGIFPIALISIVCLCVLLFKLDAFPRIWFDEGYKLNEAYTVAHDGLYASYTVNGYVPFDPGTSGGPADILPAALAIKLLGATIFTARLSSVLYTLLASLVLYQMGSYLWGKMAALFCVLLLIASPPISQVSFTLMGRQSLSEATAFSLMILGMWILSYAWRSRSLPWSIISGLIMGLGMLSKTQIAIGLIPALMAVAGWRFLRERKGLLYLFAPAAMVVAVFVLWMFIGQLLTPPDIRHQNSVLLMDAITTNILTTLMGSNINRHAWAVIGLMLFGTVTTAWRIKQSKAITEPQWIELLLALFVLFMTIWFAVFSIGWVRYAYAGLVVGLFLISRFIWGFLASTLANRNRLNIGLIGIVAVMALGINLYLINRGEVPDDAQRTAQYIATSIPKEAVIETWEWELDMLSGHRQFHHPDQALLFEAIRQISHHQAFNLTYDALQANPDYLVMGIFGAWTNVYSAETLKRDFMLVAEFGVYSVYKRLKASS